MFRKCFFITCFTRERGSRQSKQGDKQDWCLQNNTAETKGSQKNGTWGKTGAQRWREKSLCNITECTSLDCCKDFHPNAYQQSLKNSFFHLTFFCFPRHIIIKGYHTHLVHLSLCSFYSNQTTNCMNSTQHLQDNQLYHFLSCSSFVVSSGFDDNLFYRTKPLIVGVMWSSVLVIDGEQFAMWVWEFTYKSMVTKWLYACGMCMIFLQFLCACAYDRQHCQ